MTHATADDNYARTTCQIRPDSQLHEHPAHEPQGHPGPARNRLIDGRDARGTHEQDARATIEGTPAARSHGWLWLRQMNEELKYRRR